MERFPVPEDISVCDPMDYNIQSLVFSWPEYWSEQPLLSPGDLPNPGIEPRSPTVQADSLPAEPQGKPKNTGVGSLFLLQWIFPTQESNWGLLHCRQILYHLSHQGMYFFNGNDPDVFSVHNFSRHMKSVFPMTDDNCDDSDEVFFQASTL